MAKRKSSKIGTFRAPEPASAKAREKIATLRKYHELGRRASDTASDGSPKPPEPLGDLAAEVGVREDTIRKALMFARSYSADELERLLAQRSAEDEPLSWYLVRALLQVKDKGARSELQAKAAGEGWTRRDLWAAIRARQGGKTSPGGRRFAVPDSPHQILTRLTELSESWLRFYEDIGEEGGLAERLRAARRQGKRTAGLRRAIRETIDGIRRLQKSASKLANRLEEDEPDGKETVRRPGGARGAKSGASEA